MRTIRNIAFVAFALGVLLGFRVERVKADVYFPYCQTVDYDAEGTCNYPYAQLFQCGPYDSSDPCGYWAQGSVQDQCGSWCETEGELNHGDPGYYFGVVESCDSYQGEDGWYYVSYAACECRYWAC